jgi:hypothetical protein
MDSRKDKLEKDILEVLKKHGVINTEKMGCQKLSIFLDATMPPRIELQATIKGMCN